MARPAGPAWPRRFDIALFRDLRHHGAFGLRQVDVVRCLSRWSRPTPARSFRGPPPPLHVESQADRASPPQAGHGLPALRPPAAPRPFSATSPSRTQPGRDRQTREARAREMIQLSGSKAAEQPLPRHTLAPAAARPASPLLAVGPVLWFLDEPFSALDPDPPRRCRNEFLPSSSSSEDHDFQPTISTRPCAGRPHAIMQDGRIVQTSRRGAGPARPPPRRAFTADARGARS
jgi:hypothetical protein